MGVRLFKKILLALVDTASKNLDQTTLAEITPAQLGRKAVTVRYTSDLEWQRPHGVTLRGKTVWPWDANQEISCTQLP